VDIKESRKMFHVLSIVRYILVSRLYWFITSLLPNICYNNNLI